MKRRRDRERDEATAREQAERRREELLSDLKARLGASPPPGPNPEAVPAESPDAAELDDESQPAEEPEAPVPNPEKGA